MNMKQALFNSTATDYETWVSNNFLMGQYGKRKADFERHGITNVHLTRTENQLKFYKLTPEDVKRRWGNYQKMPFKEKRRLNRIYSEYFGSYYTDDNGNRVWQSNKTSTLSGVQDYYKKIGNTFGIEDYDKWSDQKRIEFHEFVSRVRADRPEYFKQTLYWDSTEGFNYAYQLEYQASTIDFKKIYTYEDVLKAFDAHFNELKSNFTYHDEGVFHFNRKDF